MNEVPLYPLSSSRSFTQEAISTLFVSQPRPTGLCGCLGAKGTYGCTGMRCTGRVTFRGSTLFLGVPLTVESSREALFLMREVTLYLGG